MNLPLYYPNYQTNNQSVQKESLFNIKEKLLTIWQVQFISH